MARLTVSAHFVTAALAGARRQGYDTHAMMREAGIEPELIEQEQARVTGNQYTRLMQVIDAVYEGLVQGKLCQLEQSFEVSAAVSRDVRDEDIDTMLTVLGAW